MLAMVVMAGLIVGIRALVTSRTQPDPNPTVSPTDSPSPAPTGSPSGSSTASPSPSPTGPVQQVVLLQVRDDDTLAQANAVLGTRREPERGVIIAAPPRLLVDLPGGPQVTLAATGRSPDPKAAQVAMSNLLGIEIDATWVLDRLAFSGLVDSIGGVYVEAKKPLVIPGAQGGVSVTLPKGISLIDGPTAAAYVLARVPGEAESARADRFQEVVRQILVRLPKEQSKVELLLGSLGALSRTSVPVDELAGVLMRLRTHALANELDRSALPVRKVVVAGLSADRLAFVAAERMMQSEFPDAQLVPGDGVPVRVLVSNGVARPGLAATAREPLETADFVYISGGDTPQLGYTESLVTVRAGDAAALQWGAQVAAALKLPASALRASGDPPTTADVNVILGADYRPVATPSPEPVPSA